MKLPKGKDQGYFLEFWPQLAQLGCTYERTGDERQIYSLDLPPSVSVHAVYDILTRLEEGGAAFGFVAIAGSYVEMLKLRPRLDERSGFGWGDRASAYPTTGGS